MKNEVRRRICLMCTITNDKVVVVTVTHSTPNNKQNFQLTKISNITVSVVACVIKRSISKFLEFKQTLLVLNCNAVYQVTVVVTVTTNCFDWITSRDVARTFEFEFEMMDL